MEICYEASLASIAMDYHGYISNRKTMDSVSCFSVQFAKFTWNLFNNIANAFERLSLQIDHCIAFVCTSHSFRSMVASIFPSFFRIFSSMKIGIFKKRVFSELNYQMQMRLGYKMNSVHSNIDDVGKVFLVESYFAAITFFTVTSDFISNQDRKLVSNRTVTSLAVSFCIQNN